MKRLVITLVVIVLPLSKIKAQITLTPDQAIFNKNSSTFSTVINSTDFRIHYATEVSDEDPSENIFTMIDGQNQGITAESGIILDSGGNSNYPDNSETNSHLNFAIPSFSNHVGYELSFDSVNLGPGDTVSVSLTSIIAFFFVDDQHFDNDLIVTFDSIPPPVRFYGDALQVFFSTNGDFFSQSGFQMTFKAIFRKETEPTQSLNQPGFNQFRYDHSKNFLQIGRNRKEASGNYIFNFGNMSETTGDFAFSFGENNRVGKYSFAQGQSSRANGEYSFASGRESKAYGDFSMASGFNTTALGDYSSASGRESRAYGNFSFARGLGVETRCVGCIALGTSNDTSDSPSSSQSAPEDRLFQLGKGGGTNALTVLRNAKTGVNTATPLAGLHIWNVSGTNSDWDRHLRLQFDEDDFGNIVYDDQGMKFRNWGTDDDFFFRDDQNNHLFTIYDNGNATLAGSLTQNSDLRLKKNLLPLTSSLEKVSNLQGFHYQWIESKKSDEVQTGLIAQEVQKMFPELVVKDEKDMLSVNYIGLIPHLIESIKALQKTNETLQNSFEKLEQDMADLRQQLLK